MQSPVADNDPKAGSAAAQPPARPSAYRPFDSAKHVAARILAELFGPAGMRAFDVELWDGSVDRGGREPQFRFILRNPDGLRTMLLPPSELAFAHGYVVDDVDIEGDLQAAAAAMFMAAGRLGSLGRLARILRLAVRLPSHSARPASPTGSAIYRVGHRHTRERDAQAIRSHYDVGNDFYQLWLDPRMVYSCGYFEAPDTDLAAAQTEKLDRICRKLDLQPGDRLLDIGCGWGGLLIYAAQQFGVDATGITISPAQLALARERIQAAGVAGRCRVEMLDYRDLRDRRFDKVASIGMVEHVGDHQLRTYLSGVWQALRPGGDFLLSGIVAPPEHPVAPTHLARLIWHEGQFVDRYVFPDGELVPLARIVDLAERVGFETRTVENLREHYAATLRCWLQRLEAHHAAAVEIVGEETYRVWRLYLAASAYCFNTGRTGVTETLLRKPAT